MATAVQEAIGVRTLPQDLDAERAVVGALLMSQDAFSDVIELLKPSDFYSPQLATIFETELKLFAEGNPVDSIVLTDALVKSDNLQKAGGRENIIEIAQDGRYTVANVMYYANIVRERSTLRRLIAAGTRIEQLGFTTEGSDVQNAVDIAEEEVFALSKDSSATDYISVRDGLKQTKENIVAAGNSGDIDGVPTGLNLLDSYLHGLKGGQMIVVAARPGVGKSTLALDIARNAAIHKRIPTIIFNLEMAYPEILMRLLSAEKSINHEDLQNGRIKDEEWQRIAQFEKDLVDKNGNEAPLYIDDSANISMMQIRTKCRRLASGKTGLGLVIIDYLQLMSSGQRVESRQQEVADMSRKLKLLSKEIGVPIIAISQLNRGSEVRGDRRPQLSDLRESGAIEQDADVVILVHREEMYHTREQKEADPEKARVGLADIIVAKNRAGRTGDFEVSAQMHLCRFSNMRSDLE